MSSDQANLLGSCPVDLVLQKQKTNLADTEAIPTQTRVLEILPNGYHLQPTLLVLFRLA